MKRSKAVATTLLLASLATVVAGCDEAPDEVKMAASTGMAFESYEDCAINIGAENCQKEAKQASVASSGGHTSIIPLFLPMPGFSGGYRDYAPRAQASYAPKSSLFASNANKAPVGSSMFQAARTGSTAGAVISTGTSVSSTSARGGFGSSGASAGSSS